MIVIVFMRSLNGCGAEGPEKVNRPCALTPTRATDAHAYLSEPRRDDDFTILSSVVVRAGPRGLEVLTKESRRDSPGPDAPQSGTAGRNVIELTRSYNRPGRRSEKRSSERFYAGSGWCQGCRVTVGFPESAITLCTRASPDVIRTRVRRYGRGETPPGYSRDAMLFGNKTDVPKSAPKRGPVLTDFENITVVIGNNVYIFSVTTSWSK